MMLRPSKSTEGRASLGVVNSILFFKNQLKAFKLYRLW